MKTLRSILCGFFLFSGITLFANPSDWPPSNDSINTVTEDILRKGMIKKLVPNALAIYRAGGFRGFYAAPGSSMKGETPLYDFLVQDIAIDENGNPTGENPLTAARTRDFQPGDKLSYYAANYPLVGERPFPGHRFRRYNIPLGYGHDQKGNRYPIIAGIRDLTTNVRNTEYDTFGERDGISFIGLFPEYASYLGAYGPERRDNGFSLAAGAGYIDPQVKGMARFARPYFPNPVPEIGSAWCGTIVQKTIVVGKNGSNTLPPPRNLLVAQYVIGKRDMYVFGTRDKPTRPIDTIAIIAGFAHPNDLGTAPIIDSPSVQQERIYLCKELGYGVRWELWSRLGKGVKKDVMALAKKAYAANNVGTPFDFQGKYSEHFEIGPMIDDKEQGLYYYDQIITDPKTGKKETRTWYLIGAHDHTNIQPREPWDPMTFAPPEKLPRMLMGVLGVDIKTDSDQTP